MAALLEIVQRFAVRTGIPKPIIAAGSLDPQIQQIVGLLEEETEELSSACSWQELSGEYVFNLLPQEIQFDITSFSGNPSNFILNDVIWNRTRRLPIFGPLSAQQWQQYKALPFTGTLYQYRISNNNLRIYPTPTDADQCALEYSGAFAIRSSAGAIRQHFVEDTDTVVFPEKLIIAGLRWRWKREKGLTYAEDFRRYEGLKADAISRNGTKPVLHLDGKREFIGPGVFIPSGSWPVGNS